MQAASLIELFKYVETNCEVLLHMIFGHIYVHIFMLRTYMSMYFNLSL